MFFEKDRKLKQRFDAMEVDIADFKQQHKDCSVKHEQHVEHRRRIDDKIDDLLVTVKQILSVLQDNSPVVQRTKNNYIALDTLKAWAIWAVTVSGAVTILYQLLK